MRANLRPEGCLSVAKEGLQGLLRRPLRRLQDAKVFMR
jgi:hypothetical protein